MGIWGLMGMLVVRVGDLLKGVKINWIRDLRSLSVIFGQILLHW